jgi:hypothetical protein
MAILGPFACQSIVHAWLRDRVAADRMATVDMGEDKAYGALIKTEFVKDCSE